MTTRQDLDAALQHANVQAFLRMIRHGEGTTDEAGYRRMFGGKLFDSFADHPRLRQTYSLKGKPLTSSAAGAYQFLKGTWDALVKQYGFTDFSPGTQDAAAVALIAGRRALDDVLAGRFDAAVGKCNREWASLPGSPYGQPTTTLAKARQLYADAGGTLNAEPAHMPTPIADLSSLNPTPTSTTGESTVPPFLAALLPSLLDLVPKLTTVFTGDNEVSKRNIKAAEILAGVAKEAIGAKNEQDIIETMANDPAAAAKVKAAIEANFFKLVEVGGGIEAARTANEKYMLPGAAPAPRNPAFLLSGVLLLMPFMLLADLFFVHPEIYDSNLRTQIVTAVLTVIMVIGGYWFGTSSSSARKTEIAASKEQ